MAALVDYLNSLLTKVRGIQEAARGIADEFDISDPDIGGGLEDIIDAERWSSSGLYHRISQLGGTPTLESANSESRVAIKEALHDKLKILCDLHKSVTKDVKYILKNNGLDQDTIELLDEIRSTHERNETWCKTIIAEWEPD